jgi:phosphatidylinositol alpha-1,6-mannosyltransferase
MDVFVNETHREGGPRNVVLKPLVRTAWPHWWPMVPFIRGLRRQGYVSLLVSQALPCGTAAWIARLTGGLPYSVLIHGLDLRLALRSGRKRWLLGRILRGAKAVFVNSQLVAAEVRNFDHRIHPIIITPGVEPIEFPDPAPARKALGIAGNAFQLVCVTRLVPRKGIDRLLEAMQLVPADAHLCVIGDGHDRERLLKLAEPLGERVKFLHDLEDSERNAWYAASDAFVLPVRDEGTDVEGFGIVFLEAALAGLPAIAGCSGGAIEAVMDQETGLLVNPASSQEIAAAIQALRADPGLRARLGQAGRVRALRDFRWNDRWDKLSASV